MATIGTFTKNETGFTGQIQTLGVKAKASISAVEKTGDTAPDYRVFAGKVEIGAGWVRKSKNDREYVSVKLASGRASNGTTRRPAPAGRRPFQTKSLRNRP